MVMRELINEIRQELMDHPPADALHTSDRIVQLAALLGNVNDEIGKWESEYIHGYNLMLSQNPKMAVEKVKIMAMDTPAYRGLQEAKRYSELVLELVGALKYRARALTGEYRESINQ